LLARGGIEIVEGVAPATQGGEQLAALRLRAQQRGFELPDETARYLQRRLPRDLRSLFAVLDELDAAALAAQRRLTVPFIKDVLALRDAPAVNAS